MARYNLSDRQHTCHIWYK